MMADKRLLLVHDLRQLLRADFEAGHLYWRYRPREMFATQRAYGAWNAAWDGKQAFQTSNGAGYLMGRIYKRGYLAHRVLWAMHSGAWPKGDVDHINGIPTDNRISNLRAVTHAVNQRNQKLRSTNSTGHNGVYFDRSRGKWAARVTVSGRGEYLGRFDNIEDAVAAREAADVKYGFHENHGR